MRTIAPVTELPTITEPVTIDGYTQPGASVNTLNKGTNAVLRIELSGANMTEGDGFTVSGGGTTIRGLVINRFKDESTTGGRGILLLNLAANTNNVVAGNFIGTDATGTLDRGNEGSGVQASGQSTGNTIGGSAVADRNLISGNELNGVIADSQNTVERNLIGTDAAATGDLGNAVHGVAINGASNLIRNNIIGFNGEGGFDTGITVFDSTGNRILGNSIFANAGLGIDLGNDGPTANDPQDPDSGANNLQNKPIVDSAVTSGGTTTITSRLNSTPSRNFTIQFFSNTSGNEGERFIGQKVVSTAANGNTGAFTFSPANPVAVGQRITATATGPGGNTSEFSAARLVTAP